MNTCRKETLYALDLPVSLADKIISVRRGADLKDGTADDFVFGDVSRIGEDVARSYPLLDAEKESLRHAVVRRRFCVTSDVFRIRGSAQAAGSPVWVRYVCVVAAREGIKYWAEA